MTEELCASVRRLIREAYRPFGDAAELLSTFAEVARAATRSCRAAVSLHQSPDLPSELRIVTGRGDVPWTGKPGLESLFPIVYQDVELGILSLLPRSALDGASAEVCRLIAKNLAYHLKRHQVRELAQELYGQELGLIGTSLSLWRTDRFVERASQGSLPCLILGESGSEAGAVALALHLASPSREGPFVAVNCAAFESDGFERQWRSRTRRAGGGTLLLNRIEELSRPLQHRLCEIFESGHTSRNQEPGGRPGGFRLIATSLLGIDELVSTDGFYPPLLDQIDFLRLEIEPLRNRREDLKPLLEHYLAIRSGSATVKLSDEALEVCAAYPWPGNVAEISRIASRLAVMVEDDCVRLQHIESHAPQLLSPLQGSSSTRRPIKGPEPPASGREGFHPSLQRALDFITEHYRDKLALRDVAASAYVSPSHLEHLFRRELGMTFTRFLTRLRIKHAQSLLLDRPYEAVTSIAGEVGFNDFRHFERMFKSLAGCSPRSFRQRSGEASTKSAASFVVFAVPEDLEPTTLGERQGESSTTATSMVVEKGTRNGQAR